MVSAFISYEDALWVESLVDATVLGINIVVGWVFVNWMLMCTITSQTIPQ